ncbi:MAG TPA: hypothetical protein VHX38_02285 [Pseudonocardiaceae bacterium]|nr:hypothetical protein [Pseudonocardiaceae bacterium]
MPAVVVGTGGRVLPVVVVVLVVGSGGDGTGGLLDGRPVMVTGVGAGGRLGMEVAALVELSPVVPVGGRSGVVAPGVRLTRGCGGVGGSPRSSVGLLGVVMTSVAMVAVAAVSATAAPTPGWRRTFVASQPRPATNGIQSAAIRRRRRLPPSGGGRWTEFSIAIA